ncbi:MAG: MgtC/SapB family protein [Patescibacteria group bacterium]
MLETFLAFNIPIFIKLTLAILLGGLIGVERTLANKMAGLRTYAFVSLGSCLLVIISILTTSQFFNVTNFDPLRVASAIIMGIGFICGGAIIYHDNRLLGLTTAAGMWVASGIGVAVGFGYFTLAIMTTVLTLFIFSTLWEVEEKFKKNE